MIVVSISRQTLTHRRHTGVCVTYPVSTAANGAGNRRDSFCTPLGRHRIARMIGDAQPEGMIFRARAPQGVFDPERNDPGRDWILSRILWLEGCETGINRRGPVDTFRRYIYIHGTHREDLIGSPTSHGCIRMCNADVIELFAYVWPGESVVIRT